MLQVARRHESDAARKSSARSSSGSLATTSRSRASAPSIARCSSGGRSPRSIVRPSSSAHSSPRVSRIGRRRWLEYDRDALGRRCRSAVPRRTRPAPRIARRWIGCPAAPSPPITPALLATRLSECSSPSARCGIRWSMRWSCWRRRSSRSALMGERLPHQSLVLVHDLARARPAPGHRRTRGASGRRHPRGGSGIAAPLGVAFDRLAEPEGRDRRAGGAPEARRWLPPRRPRRAPRPRASGRGRGDRTAGDLVVRVPGLFVFTFASSTRLSR